MIDPKEFEELINLASDSRSLEILAHAAEKEAINCERTLSIDPYGMRYGMRKNLVVQSEEFRKLAHLALNNRTHILREEIG